MTLKTTIAALIAFAIVLAYAAHDGAYQCETDTECEVEEARKCLFLCN